MSEWLHYEKRIAELEAENQRLSEAVNLYMDRYREHYEKHHPEQLRKFNSPEDIRAALAGESA